MKALEYIGKIYTAFVGVILILVSTRLLIFLTETNKVMEMPTNVGFAGYVSFVLMVILGIWLIITAIQKYSKQAVKDNRLEYLIWIEERIIDLEKEYDLAQKKSYGTGLEYDSNAQSILISKGGKLKGYKEVRDFINTHS